MNAYIGALTDPRSGVSFQFNAEEAKALENQGRFNTITLGGYRENLSGVTAQGIVDKDKDVVVELVGQFAQGFGHPIKDNTRVGLILPGNIGHVIRSVTKPA